LLHFREFYQAERLLIMRPDVIYLYDTVEVVEQMKQLLVLLAVVVGQNRDSIVHLQGEREHRVVHEHHVPQVSVSYYSQVLQVAEGSLDAVIPVEAHLDKLAIRIQSV
jgi:hypothetical protein